MGYIPAHTYGFTISLVCFRCVFRCRRRQEAPLCLRSRRRRGRGLLHIIESRRVYTQPTTMFTYRFERVVKTNRFAVLLFTEEFKIVMYT